MPLMSDQDGLHIWLLSLDEDPANPVQSSNQGLDHTQLDSISVTPVTRNGREDLQYKDDDPL